MKLEKKKKPCVLCGRKTYRFKENGKCVDCEQHLAFNNTRQRFGDLY